MGAPGLHRIASYAYPAASPTINPIPAFLVPFLSDCLRLSSGANSRVVQPSADREISVSIVEDDAALRDTLARYVDMRGFRCVGTCGSAEEALRELPLVKPDVVLMDINLPHKNGIEC